ALAVALLPAGDGSVELALRKALRPLDPGAPGELVEPAEAMERREAGVAAEAARECAAGPDSRWVEVEGAEETVDVVGDAGLGRAGVVVGGNQPGADGGDDRVLVVAEPDRHRPGSLVARELRVALVAEGGHALGEVGAGRGERLVRALEVERLRQRRLEAPVEKLLRESQRARGAGRQSPRQRPR